MQKFDGKGIIATSIPKQQRRACVLLKQIEDRIELKRLELHGRFAVESSVDAD